MANIVVIDYGYLGIQENMDSPPKTLYYCLKHFDEIRPIPSGKNQISDRYSLSVYSNVVDLFCPWKPVDYSTIDFSNLPQRSGIILSDFSQTDRSTIPCFVKQQPFTSHLRYRNWQLYTFLDEKTGTDRSVSGIWARVPVGLQDILDGTGGQPPSVGP